MTGQIEYYDRFGEQYKQNILFCPEPHLWTTDYQEKGRVYEEMKTRILHQEAFFSKYFDEKSPVLDIGCGFGRQAFLLGKKGFTVTGIDTSKVFVDIAAELFKRNQFNGQFLCTNIMNDPFNESFGQALLFDVLEHIVPNLRKPFMTRVGSVIEPNGILLISLPHVKKRLTSQLNNRIRKALTHYFEFFRNREEHPYPIPQEKEVASLLAESFSVVEFLETEETDYYVLRKRTSVA